MCGLTVAVVGTRCCQIWLSQTKTDKFVWFQSSLLPSLAMQETAPYKNVITHSFTLDERGSKMSKSLGNTVVPNDFINGCIMPVPMADNEVKSKNQSKITRSTTQKMKHSKVPAYGADVLRFWVATTDYTSDVSIGPSVVGKASDALRKVRKHDFDPAQHAVPHQKMQLTVDRYMLHELNSLAHSVSAPYDAFAFSLAQHSLSHFISTDLSALYMEAAKDRLYCDAADSQARRSTQTVLWLSLQALTQALAGCLVLKSGKNHHDLARDWTAIRQLRFEVNRVVEKMRQAGRVGSQLECSVSVIASESDPRMQTLLIPHNRSSSELLDVFVCSSVEIVDLEDDLENAEQFKADYQLSMGTNEAPINIKACADFSKGTQVPHAAGNMHLKLM
ncbi:hypothetical protein PsorP6_019313 [Peronosclerospora sorghi]|nr:hypothetical protein PsorP6_019313 [Peronosclerospora sorghi]